MTITTTKNPFRTSRIKPGTLPYLLPFGQTLESLVERLEGFKWQAQIVGPHGSGKTTLLHDLVPACEARGKQACRIQLRDGTSSLPISRTEINRWSPQTLVVIDGYEQLSRINRWQLQRWVNRSGCGLLATVHRAVRMPVLFRTPVSIESTRRIVAQLLDDNSCISPEDITKAFERCDGNVREVLFSLYDVYFDRMR